MEKIITDTSFIFRRARDQRIPDKYKRTYTLIDGLHATFAKNQHNRYDLCSLTFDKDWFDLEGAEMFWSDMQIKLISKEAGWNRKFPPLLFIVEVEEGMYVIGYDRNLKKTATLQKQFANMRETESDLFRDLLDDYLSDDDVDALDCTDPKEEAARHPDIADITGYNEDNQYISKFMERYQKTDRSILYGLAALDALSLLHEAIYEDEFIQRDGGEIVEFMNFFMQNFYTEDFGRRMLKAAVGLPRILRIALYVERAQNESFFEEALQSIQGKEKRNAEKLAEYFLADETHIRALAVSCEDRNVYATLLPGETESNRETASKICAALFQYGGICIFRTNISEICQPVNGFLVRDGKPLCIPVSELEKCILDQPGASRHLFAGDRCECADIQFE